MRTLTKKITLLFLILNVCIISANAQETWTLQQCIEHAIKNNIQIKQTMLSGDLAETNLTQSKAALFPSINASGSNSSFYGKRVDPYSNSFVTERARNDNYFLNGNLVLFDRLQRYNAIKQNQLELQASQFDTEKMKNDISLFVAAAYLQILFDLELLDIANQQVLLSKEQEERTKKLVSAGSVAKGNLLTIQAQVASEELQTVTLQNNLDNSYLNLAQLLEIIDIKNFKISRPEVPELLNAEIKEDIGTIYQSALANRPEVKSAQLKFTSSLKGISIAKGNLSPTLTMNGSIGSGYSGLYTQIVGSPTYVYAPSGLKTSNGEDVFGQVITNEFQKTPYTTQLSDNVQKSFGFNLTVPIFNGFQAKSSISRAKINSANANLNLEGVQKQLFKSVQQAYTDALAALKKYAATQKAVSAFSESFQNSEQRFTLGMLNSLDYNDAKNKLAKAQSDLVQAKYDFVFKKNVLNFYQGKPISF